MPYDLSGNFTRLHNWEEDRQNDVEIMSDRHDEEDDNFAEGLNECFLRDGRTAMKGDLNVGNYQVKNVAQATADSDAVNLSQVTDIKNVAMQDCMDVISSLFYIGDIKPSLQAANHGDWLLCDGQAVSRSDYADLFALIGTHFGNGDGITTFNIPDYRGKFLRGLGGDSASDIYTTQAEGIPNHTHATGRQSVDNNGNFIWNNSNQDYVLGTKAGSIFWNGSEVYNTTHSYNAGASVNTSLGNTYTLNTSLAKTDNLASDGVFGASQHVTPINMAVNYFIKAKGI